VSAPSAVLLHPGLLVLGLAAAAVPVLIHLLSRRRVRRVPWAAMEWLLAAVRRHQRRLRIENWLVLLLRMAALALLGLGLARWILSDSALAEILKPRRSVILVLDTSYSVGAKDGARTVFDRVRDEAERVVGSLGGEDTVAIVVSNDVRGGDRSPLQPALLLPRSLGATGAARAKEALASLLRPSEAPASWPETLLLAVSPTVALPEDVNRTVYWVTDLQARDWRRPDDASAPDPLAKALTALHRAPAVLRVVDASSGGRRRNLAVAELTTPQEGDVFEGHGLALRATVWNHGHARASGAHLRAFVDGSPVPARTVAVPSLDPADPQSRTPAGAVVSIELPRTAFPRGSAGSHEIRVEVVPSDADAASDVLSLDSERRLVVDVRSQLRIAAWTRAHPKSRADPRQLLRGVFVGEGAAEYDLRFADGEAALRDLVAGGDWTPDLVVLANTAPGGLDLARTLASYVRTGGALLVFVGDQVTGDHWNAIAHQSPDSRLLPFPFGERREADRGKGDHWSFDLSRATAHPLSTRIAGEASKWYRDWAPPRVWGRMPLLADSSAPRVVTPAPAEGDDDRVVLRFLGTHGEPGPIAIAEGRLGTGRAIWVGTAMDDAWLDVSSLFLPVFLQEAALELTRPPDRAKNVLVGGRLVAPLSRDPRSVRIEVPGRGADTPRVRPEQTETDRPVALYDRTGVAGTYRLAYERPPTRAGAAEERVEELFAVNPDPAEGDLRRAATPEVEGRLPGADVRVLSTFEEAGAAADTAREGEVSPYVLLGVLLLLLAESFLAMRFNRHGDRSD
jgi:hypothetical protein